MSLQLYDHVYVETNGITLHVVQAGPSDGPPVILLHGFPEYWHGWHRQIDFLAAQGYRVWVPDQRGYNLSDKPDGVRAYNLEALAADVIGLVRAMGEDAVFLAGHDWGGAVAWWTANQYPQHVRKLAILNVPHHAVMRRAVTSSWGQLRKSWYILAFQIPWLPERLLLLNGAKALADTLTRSSRRGTFSAEQLAEYQKTWLRPKALTSMINWYRALFQAPPPRLPSIRITVPVRIIWGKRDHFLGEETVALSLKLCDEGEAFMLDKATHWVAHEEPDEVNRLMADFFR